MEQQSPNERRGPDVLLCGAKLRQGEGTCKHEAGWGCPDHPGVGVCRLHGGNTKSHKKKAAQEIVQAEVIGILHRETITPMTDPLYQLQMLAAEAVRIKDIFADKVEELEQWDFRNREGTEDVRAVVAGLERGIDRAHRIVLSMARLDLDARLVKISEAQADLIQYVIERMLNAKELGLTKPRKELARGIIAREIVSAVALAP